MQSNKNIEHVLNRRGMRSNLNTLLTNGNNSTIIFDKKQKYLVTNTYAYDSVAVIIFRAYLDNPNYKMFIDSNKHPFFEFCKTLATNTTTKVLNKNRFKILQCMFAENNTLTDIKLINAECNVTFIITVKWDNFDLLCFFCKLYCNYGHTDNVRVVIFP